MRRIWLMVIFISLLTVCYHKISLAGMQEYMEAMKAMNAVKAMSQTKPLMLDPIAKEKIDTVYIEVYDSTGVGIPVEILKEKFEKIMIEKGYRVVQSPSEAGYVVQFNFNNIYIGKPKKGTTGIGAGILGNIAGYAGLVAGIAGGPLGMQLGASLGSAVGEAIGEKAESALIDSLTGSKYQYIGTVAVHVIQNVNQERKEYDGVYPLAGEGEKFSAEDFAERLSLSLQKSVFNEFNRAKK